MPSQAITRRASAVAIAAVGACALPLLGMTQSQNGQGAPSWGLALEARPDAAVVTDAAVRSAIEATGLPWKVRHMRTGIEMVLVPPGTFRMGAAAGDGDATKAELPSHEVTVAKPFYIGRTEVTQRQWQSVMGSNPSRFQPSYFRAQVEGQRRAAIDEITAQGSTLQEAQAQLGPMASWIDDTLEFPLESAPLSDVESFCSKSGVRLPSEVQWEYACRAGTGGATYGSLDAVAWCAENSGDRTHAVATAAPNAFGLHDTLGNVWEWTADAFIPNAYALKGGAAGGPSDPSVDADAPRAIRGGNWLSLPKTCRASTRIPAAPARVPSTTDSGEDEHPDGTPIPQPAYGFRVVIEP